MGLELRPGPKTAAERSRKYRSMGLSVGIVLTDRAAIAALRKLSTRHGGVKPAVEHALAVAAKVKA